MYIIDDVFNFCRLHELSKDVLDLNSDLPNEYMYGRAGYLYAIMYVNKHVEPHPFDDSFIREVNCIENMYIYYH